MKNILPPLIFCACAFSFAATADAQSSTPNSTGEPQTANTNPPTKAVEDYELNISERRIVEQDYQRSSSVEVSDGSGNVRVAAGVGVSAERIEVRLRGVQGRVRFRASLAPITERLERVNKPLL